MARPLKDGLDYFPMPVANDDKMNLIEAEFGMEGLGIVLKILQRIYAQGYYSLWTKEVVLLFRRQVGVGGNTVSEVFDASLSRGFFDRELYQKFEILTSKEIQETYFKAVERRKQVRIDSRYLLVDIGAFLKNDAIYRIDDNNNAINEHRSTQSKVKESKGEESRGECVVRDTSSRAKKPTLDEVIVYGNEIGLQSEPASFFDYYEAHGWLDKYGRPIVNWQASMRRWKQNDKRLCKQTSPNFPAKDPRATAGSSIDMAALDAYINGQFADDGEGNV